MYFIFVYLSVLCALVVISFRFFKGVNNVTLSINYVRQIE